MNVDALKMAKLISDADDIVFLTGAGASTASGIPDYRSVEGLYTNSGLKTPEYLLSKSAMLNDTADFHQFIKQLYNKNAAPNIIHEKMAMLEKTKNITVITQNIDGLHTQAGSKNVIEFHGTLTKCHCETCGSNVVALDFLNSYTHEHCGGITRPNIVLYEENINYNNIVKAYDALSVSKIIIIVGTTFQVHPFASLINYAQKNAKIFIINREDITHVVASAKFLGDAAEVFSLLV